MKTIHLILATVLVPLITIIASHSIKAEEPSAFGSGFDVQDFYKPFTLEEITPENQQKWPYYKYVSTHWDDYALHGTEKIKRSTKPVRLTIAEGAERLNMNSEWKDGKTFIESLLETQVKGFVVIKDNKILAEFYDNGFKADDTNLLQSASKTFAGIITHQLIDDGLLDPNVKVENYLEDLKGTDIGAATVQQVLDMTSGLPTLLNFHTPGHPDQQWEVEIGLQQGQSTGHRENIKNTIATSKPGVDFNYSDMNTDTLGLLAEKVSGKNISELLGDLFDAFGANNDGSIALTSDGTYSPSYGISISARDYALFQQWIAQRKAPKSYYLSAMDTSKTKFGENDTGKLLGGNLTYGSQSYYLYESDVLYSSGSFGQIGYSDMQDGIAVIFLQDWAVNAELEKFFECRDRALAIINHLRAKSLARAHAF